MTAFVRAETLTPEQLVAIRINTRYRLQNSDFGIAAVLAIRPLLASDFEAGRGRLEAADLPARWWQLVGKLEPSPRPRAVAIMGVVAYAARPAIDYVRLSSPNGPTETFTLAEINAASRIVLDPALGAEQFVDLRRIGYMDPAYFVHPQAPLAVEVLSDSGLERESFDLIGMVAEPA